MFLEAFAGRILLFDTNGTADRATVVATRRRTEHCSMEAASLHVAAPVPTETSASLVD
jgi:hypothetical protein